VNAETWKREFVTKDSGAKAEYADGMRRDTAEGKPTFSLMFPKDVPYEEQLLTRVAMLYMRGGVRYGARNWEKSSTEESLAHHEEALWRHFVKFVTGVEDGEDHAAAVVWNVNAVLLTRRNIKLAAEADAVNSGNTAERLIPVRETVDGRQAVMLSDEISAPVNSGNKAGHSVLCRSRVTGESEDRCDCGEAVNSGNTVDPHGYDITRVGDSSSTYIFPVAGQEYVSEFGSEIKIKARDFFAARRELDKILGRETAEHSMELGRQQDGEVR
jgi:dATP/dGTP diphosphohydrolase